MTHVTDLPPLPPRPDDAHKGIFGTLLLVGGSTQMTGAPMLAARSAYRAGCGLVRVAMPQSVLAAALSVLPEAIGLGFEGNDGDAKRLREALTSADAIAAGPGLGQEPSAEALLDEILQSDLPAVLDADALNHLAKRKSWPKREKPTVLTPHPGEMKRLLAHVPDWDEVPKGDEGRIQLATAAAKQWNVILVLKGRRTVITDGERVWVNQTGDVTLAKAGSGDVLTGLIGSLLAQGMNAFDAAICGVHYHGLAGETAGRDLGQRGALATDIADCVARVMA